MKPNPRQASALLARFFKPTDGAVSYWEPIRHRPTRNALYHRQTFRVKDLGQTLLQFADSSTLLQSIFYQLEKLGELYLTKHDKA